MSDRPRADSQTPYTGRFGQPSGNVGRVAGHVNNSTSTSRSDGPGNAAGQHAENDTQTTIPSAARTQQQGAGSSFGRHDARQALQSSIGRRHFESGNITQHFGPYDQFTSHDGQVGSLGGIGSSCYGQGATHNRNDLTNPAHLPTYISPQRLTRSGARFGDQRSAIPAFRGPSSTFGTQQSSYVFGSTQSHAPDTTPASRPVTTARIRRAMLRSDWERLRDNHGSAAEATLESEKRHAKRRKRDGDQ